MSELVLIEPKEKPKASEAFALYWALGPKRSLAKLADFYLEQGYSANRSSILRQFQQWSSDNHWQDRIKAIAAEQIAEAAELRSTTYVAIAREYHRRFTDPAMVKVAKLDSLNSVYDRVKPSEADQDAAAPPVLIQIIGVQIEAI